MKSFFAFIVCLISFSGFSQDISSQELLDKAISYHDPNGNWASFNDTFTVEMTMPNAPKRTSVILLIYQPNILRLQQLKTPSPQRTL